MGSLMAGWDSPVLADDNKVRLMRNRSLTKEEVEAFRKQQQQQQHGSSPTRKLPEDGEATARSLQAPASSPLAARGVRRIDPAALVFDDAGESPSQSRDWWTRSSWAFLNEPPQEEAPGKAQSYAPQFHVARIATGNA